MSGRARPSCASPVTQQIIALFALWRRVENTKTGHLMASSSSWGSWTHISPALSVWRASESQSQSQSHPGWSSSVKARGFGWCARRGLICLQAICWCPGSADASPHTTSACTFQWTRSRIHLGTKAQQQLDTGPAPEDTFLLDESFSYPGRPRLPDRLRGRGGSAPAEASQLGGYFWRPLSCCDWQMVRLAPVIMVSHHNISLCL